MNDGDVLIHGHTHVPVAERMKLCGKDIFVLNPGSVSLPKEGSAHSFGILDGDTFTIYDMDFGTVKSISLKRA